MYTMYYKQKQRQMDICKTTELSWRDKSVNRQIITNNYEMENSNVEQTNSFNVVSNKVSTGRQSKQTNIF